MMMINLTEEEDKLGRLVVFAELLQVKTDTYFDWEPMLIDLAESGKKIVFVLNELDDMGMEHCIFNFWLEHSDNLCIKTNRSHIKSVLDLLYENVEYYSPS